MTADRLTHLDAAGNAHMVDVGDKPATRRIAEAEGWLLMAPATLAAFADGRLDKGDALATARIAGIMGAKRTAELVPLCHPLPLSHVAVTIDVDDSRGGLHVTARTETRGPTGVEMEALTAIQTALLTLYDMGKALQRDMVITDVRLVSKAGGRSGDWQRTSPA